ncbi:MAG: hypothetical protein Q8M92_08370, partial [Candidatus Subteraquimicrobiales bacterium]|nr:hypothetical protein [Candidatus Subteraquimicrobiales bacterium]
GAGSGLPLAGLAAAPLMSRRVTKKLQGKDKESARYKTFGWVGRNPEAVVGAAFAPHMGKAIAGGVFDMKKILSIALQGKRNINIAGSLARTGLNVGKVGLAATIPLAYIGLRKAMVDSREQEKKLINRTIKKNKQVKRIVKCQQGS